jgi:nicotinamidase/pyrazinamidase
MKALLIVDVQNDFLPGGLLSVPKGDEIIPIINELQAQFDLVVATQDWHPPTHQSFASQHAGKKPFDEIELHGLHQILWPDHCVQGTPGAEFSDRLNLNKAEAIFRKGTVAEIDSYSGFYDNGHRKSTGLADYLRGKKVKQVYLCGLAGDICVYFSALDSLKEGFETFLIEDACRPIDEANYKARLQDFQQKGGKVVWSGGV